MTATPAAMLGLENVKGSLAAGADADLVILSEHKSSSGSGAPQLTLDEVWKFGSKAVDSEHARTSS